MAEGLFHEMNADEFENELLNGFDINSYLNGEDHLLNFSENWDDFGTEPIDDGSIFSGKDIVQQASVHFRFSNVQRYTLRPLLCSFLDYTI